MTQTLDNYPFVKELHEEFYEHKKTLSEWHENNNYGYRILDYLDVGHLY